METMTDAVCADNLHLLINTQAQAESQLLSQEQAVGSIGFYMNANKTEYKCFKQKGVISTQNCKPLKLEDQFPYLGSNISSTENNVKIHLAKVLHAVDRLSIIL